MNGEGRMQRRSFVTGLVSLAAWPRRVQAQSARRYRIGVLDTSAQPHNTNFRVFQETLRALGHVEGESLAFEYRSAEGHNERFPEFAAELARLDVDLILTRGTPAALAAKAATTTIPVVMAAVGDPQAIAQGTRNLTGFGANLAGAERKRVETLKVMLPSLTRIGALMNLSNPSRQAEWQAIASAARALGVAPLVLDTRGAADIARAFDAVVVAQTDAVLIGSDTVMQTNQNLLIELAAAHRMPAIYTFRDFVEAGGLVSYGVSLPDLYRRAAAYADRIFKGATPRDLPVEPPTTAELVVNRATAKTFAIADAFLAQADAVIG
jgi:putative ABC transport system substrate-binding protein